MEPVETIMRKYSELIKEIEDLDPKTYGELVAIKSDAIIRGLTEIDLNGRDGLTIYTDFILGAIAADGKLDRCEYNLIRPVLEVAIGRPLTYEEALKFFEVAGLDRPHGFKKAVERMVEVIGIISPELREDIVEVSLLICAVDRTVSLRERQWIKRLMD